jgi:hypothetical protein
VVSRIRLEVERRILKKKNAGNTTAGSESSFHTQEKKKKYGKCGKQQQNKQTKQHNKSKKSTLKCNFCHYIGHKENECNKKKKTSELLAAAASA